MFFLAGIQDIFVCFMLWFMMDDEPTLLFERHNNNGSEIYQGLDIFASRAEGSFPGTDINNEEQEDYEEEQSF